MFEGRGGSFWHQATERITEQDGGVLQLWQAVLDKWECRKPLPFPSDAERATAIEMVQNLFDAIESLTTSRLKLVRSSSSGLIVWRRELSSFCVS